LSRFSKLGRRLFIFSVSLFANFIVMQSNSFTNLFFILFIILMASLQSLGQEISATEVIKKADEVGRGKTSHAEMTMTIVRSGWSRSISIQIWSKGNEYSLIYLTAPAKEKGQVFLKRENEMWNWIPSIERIIKVPASMMMQSWMGSDFTNDDLVKESSIVSDYQHTLLGREMVREQECYKIQLDPKPDALVTWGKMVTWITVKGYLQWQTDYYDEELELVSKMTASDIKRMSDRDVATHLEMIPMNKTGQKTILDTKFIEFNQPIRENFFTQQNMKAIK